MKPPKWVTRLRRKGYTVREILERNHTAPLTWYGKVANWLDANDREAKSLDLRMLGGHRLAFKPLGLKLGRPVYRVDSLRGGFSMGRMEWSPQWREGKFIPEPDVVFDKESIAELYAKLKEYR